MQRFNRLQIITVYILTFVLCSFISTAGADEIALYVSTDGNDSWSGNKIDKPFATIQKARDTIRAMKKKGELKNAVTVYIRGGLYELTETLVFTVEDSGTKDCPITYTAYKDEKPVISRGRSITGQWKDYKDKIKVCTIDAVKKGKWNFRQLFADGNRQTRARIPDEDYFLIEEPLEGPAGENAFMFKEGDIKNWHNLNDVEVVIFHSSNESRLFISELNEEERIVSFSGPVGRSLVKGRYRNRYYIENTLEGLDKPGEWYLDRHTGKLYYWPIDDGQLSELRAPVLNELVRFEGDIKKENCVQYINIRGLTFCETSYILPEEGIGTIGDVSDIWLPAAVTLKGISECAFEDNTIRNVATYGLDITGNGNRITGNTIYDTGSGGIVTKSYGKERNVISYNHIHNCGEIFHSAVGINIDDGGGLISHNLIHDISHSGIYTRHLSTEHQPAKRKNQQQELIIEYNEIYDVMKIMNDGAGVFVCDSNIVIKNNLIHDIQSYGRGAPGWGIALGFNTANTRVENNLVYRTSEGLYIWGGNKNNTIENNIFVNPESALMHSNNPKDRQHENVRLIKNIFYYSSMQADLFKVYGERSAPSESDYNVFWNPGGCIWTNPVIWGMKGIAYFEDWQKHGFDKHSTVKDPLFLDKANDNYSLKPDSPAIKMGFKPLDFSRVGLRGR